VTLVATTKQNASTAKTRRRIHDACLRLAELQDIRTLTVNQIARESGLNRTTFYLHYAGTEQLIEAVVGELLDRLSESSAAISRLNDDLEAPWEETFFRTIAEQHRLFARLFSGAKDDEFVRRFTRTFEISIQNLWNHYGGQATSSDAFNATRVKFAASGVIGMILGWLEEGMPVDSEQICVWCWEFIAAVGMITQPTIRRFDEAILRQRLNTPTS
jgi:AcrR family transcriptional regulator